MEKKLTRRQQQFLVQFLDLYREMNQPIHYKFVAERLKIGNVSVYEMLRLLEFNGFVKAEFTANSNRKGPGRPSVLFYPTRQAFEHTQRLAIVPPELEVWRNEKDAILEVLRKKDPVSNKQMAEQLLEKYGEETFALLHVTRNVTILLIILSQLPETPKKKILFSQMARLGVPGQMGLTTFFGFGVGVAFFGLVNDIVSIDMLKNISKYEYYLQDMHADNHQRLCDYIRDVVALMNN
jgi:DNA-binding PadR family transcriptional regulator